MSNWIIKERRIIEIIRITMSNGIIIIRIIEIIRIWMKIINKLIRIRVKFFWNWK